ncbi:MAG: hypothetical protein ACOX1X_07390 [Dethiobacteria bacterium]
MAKKYNKSRKQKPNYSKRGRGSFNVETASDFDLESKITDKKSPEHCEQCISPKEK